MSLIMSLEKCLNKILNFMLVPIVFGFNYFDVVRSSSIDVACFAESILLPACCPMNELKRRLEKLTD